MCTKLRAAESNAAAAAAAEQHAAAAYTAVKDKEAGAYTRPLLSLT
jgi:hypothetical protein